MTWLFKWGIRGDRKLKQILQNQEAIMTALDDLTAEVTKVQASITSAITLIEKGSSDAAQLEALAASLATSQTALDAAVAAAAPVTAAST